MIKPANIILTLVGSAVVGGSAWRSAHPRRAEDDDWGSSSRRSSGSQAERADPVYPNDYYVAALGYYHAPFHNFYPERYNAHDEAKGWYYAGSWHPTESISSITTSTPAPEVLARLRQLMGSGTVADEYPNNAYVPGMGYYHASHHAFFPYSYNYYDAGRGYYYGGSWWPRASPSTVRSSSPSPSVASQLRRALTTGTMISSSGGHYSSSSTSGGHGFSSSSGKSSGSSSSVSRGGFGSSSHSSGSSGSAS